MTNSPKFYCAVCEYRLSRRSLELHHFPIPAKYGGEKTINICTSCHDAVDRQSTSIKWLGQGLVNLQDVFYHCSREGRLVILKLFSHRLPKIPDLNAALIVPQPPIRGLASMEQSRRRETKEPTDRGNKEPEINIELGAMNMRRLVTYTGICERTLRQLVKEQRIPHFRVGKSVRFIREQIDAWARDGGSP